MKMKANIDVQDRREADAIRAGLEDPELRTQVIMLGMLRALTPRVRNRVIAWVKDRLDEGAGDEPAPAVRPTDGDGQSATIA
jgi:hypothetical protein